VRARDRAGRPRVIHVFEGAPGTHRGISPLVPALQVARQFDQLADATLMAAILPKWAQAGGIDDVLKRLADPVARERIKANPKPMWLIVKARQWKDIILLNATENKDLVGASFDEIGRLRGVDPYDAVLDILLEEGENMMATMWSSKSFLNTDIDLCLQQPECAVISDTVAVANDGILSDHIGSLSGYGWAARFLQHYVRDRGILTLAQGIAKITGIPADRLGLKGRAS
jgi:N-acyl-D-aspartate/D-glutamate deacylase